MSSFFWKKVRDEGVAHAAALARWSERADAIVAAQNPAVRPIFEDDSFYMGLRAPRRSGKSFALTSLVLEHGERHPGSRLLIISLTLKSTRENFWSGAPGGIFRQNQLFGLGLKFNHTDSVWWHESGSRGRLAGAETKADIENLRGAAAEADIVVVDECKSFAPDLLVELIRDILRPGLMTRDGRLILAGTPGSIPEGPFFEATSDRSRVTNATTGEKEPTAIPWALRDSEFYQKFNDGERWSLHTWTIKDNLAAPRQWARALQDKKLSGWADDHPTWRREYLGEWVTDQTDLVYGYAAARTSAEVQWEPLHPKKRGEDPLEKRTGLPAADGPWHLVMGLDFGFEDDCALVLAGYSETLQELRVVDEFKSPHLTVDDFADEIIRVIEEYGAPEVIVGDNGGLGKMLIETLNQRHGLSIIAAEKKEKFDHIELLNADFKAGRVKIIPGSNLERELLGLQWDLSKNSKAHLARTGKLREDPSCPNHLCDALLYLWRYAYHFWAVAREDGPPAGTSEWWQEREREELEDARARRRAGRRDPQGFAGIDRTVLTRDDWRLA